MKMVSLSNGLFNPKISGELLEGNGYSIRFVMEESAEFMENKLEDYLQKYLQQIVDIAQKQYDDWEHLLSTDKEGAKSAWMQVVTYAFI